MPTPMPPARSSRSHRRYVFEQPSIEEDTPRNLFSCQADHSTERRRRRRQQRLDSLNESASSLDSEGSVGRWGISGNKKHVTFNEHVQIRYFGESSKKEIIATPSSPRSQQQYDQFIGENDEVSSVVSSEVYEQQQRQLDFSYIRIIKNVANPDSSPTASTSKRSVSPASKVAAWTDMVQDYWTSRGLESYCDEDFNGERRRARLQYTMTVILLQARFGAEAFQRHKVWLEVARQTASITKASHRRAHRQGLLDELAVHCDLSDGIIGQLQEVQREKSSQTANLQTTLREQV